MVTSKASWRPRLAAQKYSVLRESCKEGVEGTKWVIGNHRWGTRVRNCKIRVHEKVESLPEIRHLDELNGLERTSIGSFRDVGVSNSHQVECKAFSLASRGF